MSKVDVLLKEFGFEKIPTTLSKEDWEKVEKVKKELGREDLSSHKALPLLYEYPLSPITSFFVEGKTKDKDGHYFSTYRFTFYKASFYLKGGESVDVKVYGTDLAPKALMNKIQHVVTTRSQEPRKDD